MRASSITFSGKGRLYAKSLEQTLAVETPEADSNVERQDIVGFEFWIVAFAELASEVADVKFSHSNI